MQKKGIKFQKNILHKEQVIKKPFNDVLKYENIRKDRH